MKKRFLLTFAFSLIIFSVLSSALQVQEIEKNPTVISEAKNPAIFDLIISNTQASEEAEIYSLVSVDIYPDSRITLPRGETKIQILANPRDGLRKNLGYITFEYQIKGENSGIYKDNLLIKIVEMKDVFEISQIEMTQTDREVRITVKNLEKTKIPEMKLTFESPFFEKTEITSFNSLESKTFTIPINKETSKLLAGQYIVKTTVEIDGEEAVEESVIDYLEKEGTSVTENSEGFIIKETTISKTNKGNTKIVATINHKKNIISRLFTINSEEPMKTERQGFSFVYTWQRELQPDETFEIRTTTNYTIPLLLLIVVAFAAFVTGTYLRTAVGVTKKVYLVKSKGGEFSLKINLRVKARKNVENVRLIDSLPGMTKLYDKFGKLPDKVDHANRKLTWEIGKLAKGEERIYSYVIYSNLKVVGTFTLPSAFALFTLNHRHHEARSNKAFFASELAHRR